MLSLNIDYVKTPQGILKILQMVLLLIAFSCITDCCDGGRPYTAIASQIPVSYLTIVSRFLYPQGQLTLVEKELASYSRNVSFFLAVTVLGWMLVLFFFFLFILKFHERFSQVNWEMMVMVTSIVWSVLLLLCCSLMGNISNTVNSMRPKVEESLTKGRVLFTEWLDKMITGVVFGFFSWLAFIVDAVLLIKTFWSNRCRIADCHNPPGDNPA